jgi:hypothetical protein
MPDVVFALARIPPPFDPRKVATNESLLRRGLLASISDMISDPVTAYTRIASHVWVDPSLAYVLHDINHIVVAARNLVEMASTIPGSTQHLTPVLFSGTLFKIGPDSTYACLQVMVGPHDQHS